MITINKNINIGKRFSFTSNINFNQFDEKRILRRLTILSSCQSSIINHQSSIKRATALLLVVVLLAMLAIIGTTFVITSRIENVAVRNQMQAIGMEQSLKAVCSQIQETLATDLWGHRIATANTNGDYEYRQRLLGLPCEQNGKTLKNWGTQVIENEPWDAAWVGDLSSDKAKYYYFDGSNWQQVDVLVDGDAWLASTEPNASSQWQRGSDIFNLGTNDFDNIPYKALSDPSTTDDELEKYADADGDGYFDSVWIVQEGFFSEQENPAGSGIYYADVNNDGTKTALTYKLPIQGQQGLCYRIACRIVDTCSMINANIAWTIPSEYAATGHPEYSQGNLLAGVKLYDNNFGYNSDLPGKETSSYSQYTFAKMLTYQNSYIFKIEQPDWTDLQNNFNADFYPLDISDELEMRYKWNTNNPNITTMLEKHFNPTKRYCLTTYSFSRNIRRESAATTLNVDTHFPSAYNLEDTIKDLIGYVKDPSGYDSYITGLSSPEKENRQVRLKLFVKYLKQAMSFDNNYADSSKISPPAADYHTWQYIANLVDYLDNDLDSSSNPIDIPTVIDTSNTILQNAFGLPAVNTDQSGGTNNKVYGLERHLAITEVAIECVDDSVTDNGDGTYTYTYEYKLWIELANPWDNNVTAPNKVTVDMEAVNGYFEGNTSTTTLSKDIIPNSITPGTNLSSPYTYGSTSDFSLSIRTTVPPGGGNLNLGLKVIAKSIKSDGTNEIAEDILCRDDSGNIITFRDTDNTLPTNDGSIRTYKKDTSDRWKALSNIAVSDNNNQTIGQPNTGISISVDPCGYATSTAQVAPDVYRDPTNSSLWDSVTIGSNTYYFAKMHNFFDIAAVPYVGYIKDNTGVQMGIGDWLKSTDDKIHFDFTDNGIYDTTLSKAGVLRDKLFEAFKLLDRADDGKDQLNYDGDNNENTNPDNIDEMRLAGLININTAPSEVLQALHSYIDPSTGNDIAGSSNKPFKTIGELLQKQDSLKPASGQDFFILGLSNATTPPKDVVEKSAKWTRIANLITNRSDTFCAYLLIEALDKNGTVQSRERWIVLFDRSLCNQPPLIWDGTQWKINPLYRKPKIIAMQRVE